jgi:predicted transcriptional regulator
MSRRSSPVLLGKLNFGRPLGPLELRIMEIVWRRGSSNVREVLTALSAEDEPEIAYTTVMTVMGNLADKGLLQSSQAGRTYIYSATVTRGEFIRKQVKTVLDTLLDGFTEPTLSYFADRLSASDPQQLTELERRIAEKRARQRDAGEEP